MQNKRLDFWVNLGVGAVIALSVILLNLEQEYGVAQRVCDGCFVAAVILLGSAGLVFARNNGTFDMITYSVRSVFQVHFPNSEIEERKHRESFVDYTERKKGERKMHSGLWQAGLVYLILSAVALVIYYMV